MSISEDIYQTEEQDDEDASVRPRELSDFIGQQTLRENLGVYLTAAKLRKEALDHILFSGPPGLGKTTLARILAGTQGAGFHQISAPNLRRPGDLASILASLQEMDVLFIDEIHRLPANVEEILYTAMEDRFIDIKMGEGLSAMSVPLKLPPFTLVGATTKQGSLSSPLTDRFGIKESLVFYEPEELEQVASRAAGIWNIQIEDAALTMIASRSRRTPRIALRLLRRVWDYATVESHRKNKKEIKITSALASDAFERMGIDSLGLTRLDLSFLQTIAEHYDGGPVGLKAVSAVLAEDLITLEDYIEPYMVRIGFVRRTQRGRCITKNAAAHIGIDFSGKIPKLTSQSQLFEESNQ